MVGVSSGGGEEDWVVVRTSGRPQREREEEGGRAREGAVGGVVLTGWLYSWGGEGRTGVWW